MHSKAPEQSGAFSVRHVPYNPVWYSNIGMRLNGLYRVDVPEISMVAWESGQIRHVGPGSGEHWEIIDTKATAGSADEL